jgi:ATP-dependent DNA helicase PIF1
MSSKNAYYAVAVGHQPGIYDTWSETNDNVHHYPGAVYKGFPTYEAAEEYLQSYREKQVAAKAAVASTSAVPSSVVPSKLNTLTHEQRSVIDHLLQGENLFLTGGGGVGKSYLLSVIYTEFPELKKRMNEINYPNRVAKHPRIQMCALTGCASLLLGHKTKTLHSWAGIGLGKGTIGELHVKIRRNTKAMRNWLCTDLLIIDEISMMTGELLDKLNELGKKIRSNSKPFGGIQLFFSGDMLQLPPVGDVFPFLYKVWDHLNFIYYRLEKCYRQADQDWADLLCKIRVAHVFKKVEKTYSTLDEKSIKTLKTNFNNIYLSIYIALSVNKKRKKYTVNLNK